VHGRHRLGHRPQLHRLRPLQNGATTLMYEGAPNFPEPDRFWRIIDRHKVNIFYTAPTAIRAFMRFGDEWPAKHADEEPAPAGHGGRADQSRSLDVVPREHRHNRCPIVDTWWQTETGMIMIAPLPGATPTKPGSATRPLPGVAADVVTREGEPVPPGGGGFLVMKRPWPAMLRTIYGDPKRYEDQYWSQIPGMYFTGDGARKDADGYFWIMGRIDDVINVSGHRLSTMEVESAGGSPARWPRPRWWPASGRSQGPGDRGLRHAEAGNETQRRTERGVAAVGGQGDRLLAKPDDIRFSDISAQDAQRQDHAAPAEGDRRRRRGERRHHHAGRPASALNWRRLPCLHRPSNSPPP
jgi:acetyl-CoA synthetase